jgi:hypothetical protein
MLEMIMVWFNMQGEDIMERINVKCHLYLYLYLYMLYRHTTQNIIKYNCTMM